MVDWRAVVRTTAMRAGAIAVAVELRLRSWRRKAHERHVVRRVATAGGLVLVALVGTSVGLLLGGRVHQDVGPFSAQFTMRPSLSGGTAVQIPPLGSLDLRSHDGPAHLEVRLDALDQKRAQALVNSPNGITIASQNAVFDVQRGVTRLAFQSAGAAVLGAMMLASLIYRDMRRIAISGGLALLIVAGSGAFAFLTFRPNSVEEPQYHGLLSNAPAVIGDARSIANRFDAYKAELQRLVNNVSRLYGTVSTLPVYQPDSGTIRALHVSDLHLNPAAWPLIQTVVQQYQINVVLDTGDINDWGSAMESSFVDSIGTLNVPYVYIRGNHDSVLTAAAIAKQRNAVVLENSVKKVAGLTVAGIGDPRFTPDKSTSGHADHVVGAPAHQESDALAASADTLASTIRAQTGKVDLALVHDPASAGGLAGAVPLVLCGHLHHRETSTLKGPAGKQTFLMVQGSTGGAGLRGLEGEQPTPLEMSVLYFDPKGEPVRRARTSSRTVFASACPRVAFMTAPTMTPAAATLPSRTFAATSGFAAIASSTAAVSAPVSDTTARPRAAITADGEPSPATTPSRTVRASLSVSLPSSISACSSATCAGVASDDSSAPVSLATRDSSPSHHLRAASGDAPTATVASISDSASALTIDCMSCSESPHVSRSRSRRARGGSGRAAFKARTQAGSGARGTRSGSGKYR
ncbi:MAG: hypothetical protein AUI10_04170 [Actinobacteria bacterium 13_2_20CM_2_72_6]|nr:MAG: hypothetical protein AUI10_04170 [Actinobacteria bacterium 13_2_20CM_2_72_6]